MTEIFERKRNLCSAWTVWRTDCQFLFQYLTFLPLKASKHVTFFSQPFTWCHPLNIFATDPVCTTVQQGCVQWHEMHQSAAKFLHFNVCTAVVWFASVLPEDHLTKTAQLHSSTLSISHKLLLLVLKILNASFPVHKKTPRAICEKA